VRLLALAVVLAVALVGGYLVLDGGDYEPTPVADACEQRARPSSGDILDPAQRATLAVIDGAACDLRMSREQMLLDLIRDRNPRGVDDERVKEAVLKGIDRAEEEDALGEPTSTFLRIAVRAGGVQVLLDQLRG
jgi:hypothetical protein